MRFSSIAALATLFTTSVSAAVYPRQSGGFEDINVCTSYICPSIDGHDVVQYTTLSGVICQYTDRDSLSGVPSFCLYNNGALSGGSDSVECPEKAGCENFYRRKRNVVPVAPPRATAAAPQPLPHNMKMRGLIRKHRD